MDQAVLVIDDDIFTLRLLESLLNQAGFQVFQTDNTHEALNILEENNIDVITCDVMMPEVDGIAFLETLKKNPISAKIPVVIITAAGRQEVLDKAQSLGASTILEKPFTADQVKEALKQAQKQG